MNNNTIKKLIFIVPILAGFSSTFSEIDNKKIQESIPCLQYKPSLITRTSGLLQKAFLGYSWQDWKSTLKIKNSRAKEIANDWTSHSNDKDQKPAAIPKNIDIKNEKISCYHNVNIQNLLASKKPDNLFCNIEKNNNITYIFRMNPIVTQQYPESYPFRHAYLLAQIERNSQWITHRNLALAKISLGFGGSFLAYYLSQNLVIVAAGCLAGILSANYLKKPIEQREHVACIQRAKQLIGSEQEFSFESEITTYPDTVSINGQECNISSVKFKIS